MLCELLNLIGIGFSVLCVVYLLPIGGSLVMMYLFGPIGLFLWLGLLFGVGLYCAINTG